MTACCVLRHGWGKHAQKISVTTHTIAWALGSHRLWGKPFVTFALKESFNRRVGHPSALIALVLVIRSCTRMNLDFQVARHALGDSLVSLRLTHLSSVAQGLPGSKTSVCVKKATPAVKALVFVASALALRAKKGNFQGGAKHSAQIAQLGPTQVSVPVARLSAWIAKLACLKIGRCGIAPSARLELCFFAFFCQASLALESMLSCAGCWTLHRLLFGTISKFHGQIFLQCMRRANICQCRGTQCLF